jgi:hypothetical protein
MKYKLPGSGLMSYSAMSLFLGCPRKYGYKYFDRVDTEERDTSAMDRGRAFHLLVELSGTQKAVTQAFIEVGESYHELARVRVAYERYRDMEQSGALPKMTAREVKIVSEEHQFIGYVDMIGVDDNGKWRLGELKTTQRFDPVKWATLRINQQIALYTSFADEFAHKEFLSMGDLEGVSYRTVQLSGKKPLEASKVQTTPTGRPKKGARAEKESPDDFERRIAGDTQVYHQMVHPTREACLSAAQGFRFVKEAVHSARGRSDALPKSAGNCFAYNRACEYFAHCWGMQPEVDEAEGMIEHDDLDGAES